MERHIRTLPDGLSQGAQAFVRTHGVRLDPLPLEDHRERWLAAGIPNEQIDRVVVFEAKWGGIVLPPSPGYDGGPKYLDADYPEEVPGVGWLFEVGIQRTALPYSFGIGPLDAFGIHSFGTWVPLHESIEGWIESLSLAHHAAARAAEIRFLWGAEVDDLDLTGFEEIPAVRGVADRWWRGTDSLVAVCRGEAEMFRRPGYAVARVYSGLDEHGLGTSEWAVPTGWHVGDSTKPMVGRDVNRVLIDRRKQGIHETLFVHPDGRSLHFTTNGPRAMVVLRDFEDDEGEHAVDETAEGSSDGFLLLNGQRDSYPDRDTVEFGVGIRCLRHIIDTGKWPADVSRQIDRPPAP